MEQRNVRGRFIGNLCGFACSCCSRNSLLPTSNRNNYKQRLEYWCRVTMTSLRIKYVHFVHLHAINNRAHNQCFVPQQNKPMTIKQNRRTCVQFQSKRLYSTKTNATKIIFNVVIIHIFCLHFVRLSFVPCKFRCFCQPITTSKHHNNTNRME